jgi:general secretion pathway protein D
MIYRMLCLVVAMHIGCTPVLAIDLPNKRARKQLVSFNFENEDLVTIAINIASKLERNLILPFPPNNIVSKVTLTNQPKLTAEQAFNRLYGLFADAGYVMTARGQDTYVVTKSDANAAREPLPSYIGVSPQNLPNTDALIRYVYFFDNIKVNPAGPVGEIKQILEDLLVDPAKPLGQQVSFDANTNSVLVVGKSYNIKIAMQIVTELDKTGFREALEVIKLVNTSAEFIGKFLSEQLLAPSAADKAANLGLVPPSQDNTLFSRTTKIIADERNNSLILLGRTQALERLKDFIYRYLDVPLESGDSVLHVYDLQYLDAKTFAADLVNIIKPMEGAATQSIGAPASKRFAGVIIEPERVGEWTKLTTQAGDIKTVVQGGNRLVIAAKKHDWIALKQLIDDLDKPQPQVFLDILVVDLTLDDNRILGSQLRNKVNKQMPHGVNIQFAGLAAPVLNPTPPATPIDPNSTILGDLTNIPAGFTAAPDPSLTAGSFVLGLSDGTNGLWYVLQILDQTSSTRILSHPNVTTLNQQQATVNLANQQFVPGPVKQTAEGNQVLEQEVLPANFTIDILPRINASDIVNLQVGVLVQDFITGSFNRTSRRVVTNATVANKEVLVLGGMTKNISNDNETGIPILSGIPLIGWMFKSRSKRAERNSLMIFISPTVIRPRKFESMSPETTTRLAYTHKLVDDSLLFDRLRDPVSRWFFSPQKSTDPRAVLEKFEETTGVPQEPKVVRPAPKTSAIKAARKTRIERKKAEREQIALTQSAPSEPVAWSEEKVVQKDEPKSSSSIADFF